jgi:outer membrane lipoprotein-sorting protein
MLTHLLVALLFGSSLPEAVRQRWGNLPHLSTPFVQETYWSFLGQTKMIEGHLWFKSPNSFRVELSPPDSQVIVSDGESLWVWTPSIGLAVQQLAPDHQLPMAWLWQGQELRTVPADSTGAPRLAVELPSTSPWQEATVSIDPQSLLPVDMKLKDQSSRWVTYRFIGFELRHPPPDSLFRRPP